MQPKFGLGLKGGKRVGNRLRLGVRAGLVMTHRSGHCTIENVSATGALLVVDQPIPPNRIAMLQFHQLRLYGTVIWCRDGRCGMRFDTPLEKEDMQGMLWIAQNPVEYAKLCKERGALDWSSGLDSRD